MSNENNQGFNRFRDRHPILVNSVLMLLALIALGYIALLFIDVFTSHGQQVRVPDVRNLSLQEAIGKLEDAGLRWDISDSTTYDEAHQPGAVIDQDPKANSYIKKIRVIYLNVNAMHPRIVSLPKLMEISGRQGLATLRSMGFKNVTLDSIPSPYAGLILQVTVDGHNVAPGTGVSVNSQIRITVGDGSINDLNPDQVLDQATIDSIEAENYAIEEERYMQELEEAQARAEQEQKEQAAQQRQENKRDHSANQNKNSERDKTNKKQQEGKSQQDSKKQQDKKQQGNNKTTQTSDKDKKK